MQLFDAKASLALPFGSSLLYPFVRLEEWNLRAIIHSARAVPTTATEVSNESCVGVKLNATCYAVRRANPCNARVHIAMLVVAMCPQRCKASEHFSALVADLLGGELWSCLYLGPCKRKASHCCANPQL